MTLSDNDINDIIGDIDPNALVPYHTSEIRPMFANKFQALAKEANSREEYLIAIATEFKALRPMVEPTYRANPDDPRSALMLEAFDLYDQQHNNND